MSAMDSMQDMECSLKCLIANDDEMQLSILDSLFKNADFESHLARNGFEATEMYKVNFVKQRRPFDLILLDLNMPITDGFEAMKQITSIFEDKKKMIALTDDLKEKDALPDGSKVLASRTVFIACSALKNEEVSSKCKQYGFDALYEVPLASKQIEFEIKPLIHKL